MHLIKGVASLEVQEPGASSFFYYVMTYTCTLTCMLGLYMTRAFWHVSSSYIVSLWENKDHNNHERSLSTKQSWQISVTVVDSKYIFSACEAHLPPHSQTPDYALASKRLCTKIKQCSSSHTQQVFVSYATWLLDVQHPSQQALTL